MLRRRFLKIAGAAAAIFAARRAEPAEAVSCYKPGDMVDPATFFLDAQLKPVKLVEAMRAGAKAVALVIFGGPYLTTTDKHGGIWCEDSLDEFANLKAAQRSWKDRGVQFLGVSCPPVYSDKYGWEKNVFLEEPEDSPKYRQAVQQFLEKTLALQKDGTIPLESVYFDPRFRLLWNRKEYTPTASYGQVHPWQGRFKWHKDEQRYGTPCIWFLDPKGKVLREPLYGNNYSASPPRILFTYWEIEGALGECVSK